MEQRSNVNEILDIWMTGKYCSVRRNCKCKGPEVDRSGFSLLEEQQGGLVFKSGATERGQEKSEVKLDK